MSEVFIGQIKLFAGNFAPRDFAFCDGSILPISQYTALFSLLGTTYGGDGRSTFGLPNLDGRAPIHAGRGPGLTPRRIGERGGADTITLSSQQLPNHSHTWRVVGATSTAQAPGGNALANTAYTRSGRSRTPVGTQAYAIASNLVSIETLQTIGGGNPHNNVQPRLAVTYIIALQGTYPSRN